MTLDAAQLEQLAIRGWTTVPAVVDAVMKHLLRRSG